MLRKCLSELRATQRDGSLEGEDRQRCEQHAPAEHPNKSKRRQAVDHGLYCERIEIAGEPVRNRTKDSQRRGAIKQGTSFEAISGLGPVNRASADSTLFSLLAKRIGGFLKVEK